MIEPSCHVHVNWEHFRRNIEELLKRGHDLMPVIKADAYGHGVRKAAAVLEDMGIGWAAAGTIREAAEVRNAGFSGNIVALLSRAPEEEDVRLACEKRLSPLIHNWEGLEAVTRAVRDIDAPLGIAVKAETGMGRLGFRLEEMEKAADAIAAEPRSLPIVQVSHFAVADDPAEEEYTKRQCDVFYRAADILTGSFHAPPLGNTAGLVEGFTEDDICRPASPCTATIPCTAPRTRARADRSCP